jgi:hypothetical protein
MESCVFKAKTRKIVKFDKFTPHIKAFFEKSNLEMSFQLVNVVTNDFKLLSRQAF